MREVNPAVRSRGQESEDALSLNPNQSQTQESFPLGAPAGNDREALIEAVKVAHQAVCNASRNVLSQAIIAGTALLKLKKLIKHGEWRHYLQRHCELSERSAQAYMRIAEHRELLEANPQRAADLSLRGALKLISNATDKSAKPAKSAKATTMLSSLAWSNATADERRRFVDAIGFMEWLAAMPPSWFPELERRIDRQRAATAKNVDQTLSKALRQALSLQKTANDKNSISASVAAALNAILNKLKATGLDLNDVELTTIRAARTKRAA
jgi:hypothetical protein